MARRLTAAAVAASPPPPLPGDDAPSGLGPAIEHLPIVDLVRHPRNARTIPPSEDEQAALQASVRAVGVLMPILVAPLENGQLGVLAGWQRVRAAQAVGRTRVPAIRVESAQADQDRLSLVENTLRSDMHPVDQWRRLETLMGNGMTMAVAAATLGLDTREANQARLLAQMHPDVLAQLAREDEIPGTWILRSIANATLERQAEAMKGAWQGKGKDKQLHWQTMAAACSVQRIPRAWAVFDHKTAGVAFERDFFAQPGADDEWTTADVAGFRAAQEAALAKLVEGNERAGVYPIGPLGYGAVVPKGWTHARWFEKVPKELPVLADRDRFVVAITDRGEARAWVYQVPADQPSRAADATASDAPAAASAPRKQITDAGLQMAAAMKREALRDRLSEFRKSVPVVDNRVPILLRALLEALGAQNVTPGAADKHAAGEAIADATPESGEPSPHTLVDIACKAIADMLVFPAPKLPSYGGSSSSGPIADAIAASLGAEDYLPPCDTAEFLTQCSGDLLREAAKQVRLQPGQKLPKKVSDLRAFLVGKLPDWRPVSFAREAAGNG